MSQMNNLNKQRPRWNQEAWKGTVSDAAQPPSKTVAEQRKVSNEAVSRNHDRSMNTINKATPRNDENYKTT